MKSGIKKWKQPLENLNSHPTIKTFSNKSAMEGNNAFALSSFFTRGLMSEYQYYEFQAVDRSLTQEEMSELRSFSTRAEITPNRFTNEYSWGDFKGDEDRWMEKYFDGFLYYANWGTHILKLRLPSALLDLETARKYSHSDHFSVRLFRDKIILDFLSESEDYEDREADLHLSTFLSLRADIGRGDLRCLYLGWLSGVQYDECDEEQLEPPVPPGLQSLSPTLIELATFLRINPDLIQAAAAASSSPKDMTPQSKDLRLWLSTLSPGEKESMLEKILDSSLMGDQTTALFHINRFTQAWQSLRKNQPGKPKQRTVGQLLEKAEIVRQRRVQLETEQAAAALAERERLARIAREKRLNEIMGREPILWDQIEILASEKNAKSYDTAINLLTDLRDLAARERSADFALRLNELKQRHSAKSSFIRRIESTLCSR